MKRLVAAMAERAERHRRADYSDSNSATAKCNTARKFIQKHKYAEAEPLLRQSIEMREKALGVDDVQTLLTKYMLGRLLYTQHKFADSEQLFQLLAKQEEDLLGEDHKMTLESKHYLAESLYKLGKCAASEQLLWEVVRLRERVLGVDHEDTLKSRHWLGRTLYKLRKHAESEQLLREIVRLRERKLGVDHKNTLESMHWLARALFELEKYAESEQLLGKVVRLREKEIGVDHKNTLESKRQLASTLYKQQKYFESKSLLEQLTEQEKKVLSADHRDVQETKRLLRRTIDAMEPLTGASGAKELSSEVSLAKEPAVQTDISTTQELFPVIVLEKPLVTPTKTIARKEIFQEAIPMKAQITPTSNLEDTVQSRLSDFFADNNQRQTAYTDSEIQRVSTLLSQFNLQWSKVPRTYIVLRTIGCLELLNTFVDLGFSDHWFPVTERTLPSSLRPSKRSQFVAAQDLVMTKSMDLEKGQHCFFRKDEPLPLEMKEILGSGSYGQVNRVLSSISFQDYALKRVPRTTVFGGRGTEFVKQFIAEIQVLKRIKHDHVVEFIGSYTDPKYMGLLVLPVADMDLSTYLERADMTKHRELRTFFGCLTRALEFLHEQKIRHKDIKPSNILVHDGNVLYTDFGLAFDFADKDGSTTGSMVNGRTAKYCAPEVADCEPRNTSSDIWSLGVVFLEMTAVLKGRTAGYVYEFLKMHGTGQTFVRTNPTGTIALITELKATGSCVDNAALGWVQDMTMLQQKLRPTATSLIRSIIDESQNGDGNEAFCGICCVSDDEFWSGLDELEIADTD